MWPGLQVTCKQSTIALIEINQGCIDAVHAGARNQADVEARGFGFDIDSPSRRCAGWLVQPRELSLFVLVQTIHDDLGLAHE